MADDDVTNVYDFLDALGQTIASSDPAKRELLAQTIDAYSNDFPDDFYWSISAQAPLLLANLMMEIDSSCRPEAQSNHVLPFVLLTENRETKSDRGLGAIVRGGA